MKFGIIGGDRRQAELGKLLQDAGCSVSTYGLERWGQDSGNALEEAAGAEIVILPLPLCKPSGVLNCETEQIPIETLLERFDPNQLLLAGQIQPPQAELAQALGLRLVDYFKREELTVANAAVTAEAAVQVAMEHSEWTLLGRNCLVLGFGRIGKLLSHRLTGMGARVTATARKPADLAWIRAYGFATLETKNLNGNLEHFNLVFNTIPTRVIDETLIKQLPHDCLCVDLASAQGIDLEAADRLGLPYVWARALPGRMVPRSAAMILRDTIFNIMKEEGLE